MPKFQDKNDHIKIDWYVSKDLGHSEWISPCPLAKFKCPFLAGKKISDFYGVQMSRFFVADAGEDWAFNMSSMK